MFLDFCVKETTLNNVLCKRNNTEQRVLIWIWSSNALLQCTLRGQASGDNRTNTPARHSGDEAPSLHVLVECLKCWVNHIQHHHAAICEKTQGSATAGLHEYSECGLRWRGDVVRTKIHLACTLHSRHHKQHLHVAIFGPTRLSGDDTPSLHEYSQDGLRKR